MMWLIFHAQTMPSNTFLATHATTNDVQQAGNKPLPVLSYAARCALLQQLSPRTTTSAALIWPLAIWRNGERSENRSTIGTKPDVNNIVFGKIQSATYVLWRSSYPREKCRPEEKAILNCFSLSIFIMFCTSW